MSAPISHPQPQTLLQTALLQKKLQGVHLDRQPHPSSASDAGSDAGDDGDIIDVQTPRRAMSPASDVGKSPKAKTRRELTDGRATDPLKAFPSEIGIQIFGLLDFKSLARCARVSRRWNQSQTINYIWYLHFGQFKLAQVENEVLSSTEKPQDAHVLKKLPVGKWSRKESREDWRTSYRVLIHTPADADYVPYDPVDSPYASGTSTPNRWTTASPGPISKAEARQHYKDLKGRKSREKRTMAGGGRDKGGFSGVEEDPYGDGRFDAPW